MPKLTDGHALNKKKLLMKKGSEKIHGLSCQKLNCFADENTFIEF